MLLLYQKLLRMLIDKSILYDRVRLLRFQLGCVNTLRQLNSDKEKYEKNQTRKTVGIPHLSAHRRGLCRCSPHPETSQGFWGSPVNPYEIWVDRMILLLVVTVAGALIMYSLDHVMAQQKTKENKRRVLMIRKVVTLYTIGLAALVALSVVLHLIAVYFPSADNS